MTTTVQRLQVLPEELIRDVLVDVLDIPTDPEFFKLDGDRRSHSALRWGNQNVELRAFERRPPALLLVCKDWQRICTPLLYRTAIIRSRGQAESLIAAIAKRPDLAVRVKRLRLEGSFGMEAFRLLKATTHLTHLALVLHVYANEGISTMVRGLQLDHISPIVLVLADTMKSSKNRTQLVNTLEEVVPKWTRLQAVHMSCMRLRYGSPAGDTDAIVKHLSTAPSLHTVVFPEFDRPCLDLLRALGGNRDFASEKHDALSGSIAAHPRLRGLCIYTHGKPAAEAFTNGHPMQRKIWLRIFDFVKTSPQFNPAYWDLKIDLIDYILVCKLWRRIILPHIYANLSSVRQPRTQALIGTFGQNPALGRYVRSVTMSNQVDEDHFLDVDVILKTSPNLLVLTARQVNWSSFAALPQTAARIQKIIGLKIAKQFATMPTTCTDAESGASRVSSVTCSDIPAAPNGVTTVAASPVTEATIGHAMANAIAALREQDKKKPAKKELSVPLGPLMPFRALKTLHFEVSAKLKFKASDVPADVFPVLEHLTFTSCHTTVLKLFALFELPRLHHLALHGRAQTGQDAGDFLERHGPKLEVLDVAFFPTESVFELCTTLQTLFIRERKPPSEYTAGKWRSATLSAIRFTHEMPAKIQAQRPWGPVLETIDPENLPQLKVLHMGLSWPTTERAINSCFWIPYTELLLEKGIEIRDRASLPWIPRTERETLEAEEEEC
ncbi:hypothetical protein BD626DRAFT_516836 [Schizophyllum amplum]|uniref:Uncharacterized protein n=1 Tax=Schizophyllum amplum TaxID=97359 RepID=A0A550BWJ2_9AGAR|nr:hypothetical protein BD626DRAFT_516836 [Auriculariopsis ampla]